MPSKLGRLPADVVQRLAELPDKLRDVSGLAALWLFGSFARGEATPISDVDLAFLPSRDAGSDRDRLEAKLYDRISGALGTDEFSLVNLALASPYFAWRVVTEGRVLLRLDQEVVARYLESVYRHAPDARNLREHGAVAFLEGVKMSEPAIDRSRIADFLRLISDDLHSLREKAGTPRQEYLRSKDLQAVVERRLQTAIESCVNTGNHVIARRGLRSPQDYADVFRILGDERIISEVVANQMADMARFRNLLVHVYWQLDHGRVYDGLPGRIGALDEFVKQFADWLGRQATQ